MKRTFSQNVKAWHNIYSNTLDLFSFFLQAGDDDFNRGKLMNVGFNESLLYFPFNCFVFHDVDLIPEDDRNDYGCPHSPQHMSVAIDKFNYRYVFHYLTFYSRHMETLKAMREEASVCPQSSLHFHQGKSLDFHKSKVGPI